VVILKGLEEGDEVATSGNFLIDSQMQLAGKPSVIDPRKAMIEKAVVKKEGPLELDQFEVASIAGRTGADLEQLYQAYFSIQASLALDETIAPPVSEAIAMAAESLLGAADLPDELRPFVQGIADAAEHLDECDIDEAREDFKAISKAAIQLAARARGMGATGEFVHFYCPMVAGGEGDWLQASDELLNPYWGSKMLHCGREVRRYPVARSAGELLDSQSNARSAFPRVAGAVSGMGATGGGTNN
jgi:Cu(I)/Ag(I) efflux system membrane fusion protein